jgi:hypothetical protein
MEGNAGRVRTSDAEREKVITILRAATSEGRLTLEEGEERMAAVYAAKFRDELSPLTADLPGQGRQALLETPEAKAMARRGVARHAGFVVFASAVLIGFWAMWGLHHFFWPVFPLTFLVLGLVRHAAMGDRRARWQHHMQAHRQW